MLPHEKALQPHLKTELNHFAQAVVELNGQGTYLRKNWVDRFFSRHSTAPLKPSRLISASWKKAITPEYLTVYHGGLDSLIKELLAGTDRIYNVDETGFQKKSHTPVSSVERFFRRLQRK